MENKELRKPTRSEKLKSIIQESAISAIAALVTTILSLLTNLASSAVLLQRVSREYLIIFLIALGLIIEFGVRIFLCAQQTRRRQLTIKKLKEVERELFQSIEADISSLLRGEVR